MRKMVERVNVACLSLCDKSYAGSAIALSNASLPCALKLANLGYREAMRFDEALRKGLNVFGGKVTNKFVTKSLGLEYTPFSTRSQ